MLRPQISLCMAGLPWLTVLLCGSTAAQTDRARSDTTFFENKIRPVLVEHCYRCHSGAHKQSKGGLRLDSRAHLLKGGQSGPAAVSGKPESSLLLRAIRRTDAELKMPPGEKDNLTAEQVEHFAVWIKHGLLFPAVEKISTPSGEAVARRFWSFRPLQDTPVPKVRQAAWPRENLDHFVLARLEKSGMKPSAPADKRTLLRRVTYDLTGLPPTPEEMDAFLTDSATEAFARVVDRLLASPQYGVKWARHWLDVARYGDTRWVGAGEERRWPFAYTYRDWVIQALNEDMPYDRFVALQLAADQLPNTNPRDLAALGFLTVGRWFTGNVHDVIDDQIDVVTRGLLGLTVQCARCHDHKYDPISTNEYYSLYGLFAAARMPVEGTGLSAELPEVGPHPVDAATEKEIGNLRGQHDDYLRERLNALRSRYRTPEQIAVYLQAAVTLLKKTDNEVRSLAKTRGLSEPVLFRWVRYLQRTAEHAHPVFSPLHAFAALAESDFAAKAGAVAEQHKTNKMVNRRVAALLTPPPLSLTDLCQCYAQLLTKCDLTEPASEPDREALRQMVLSNEWPAQISLGELGQYLTTDETERVLQMRRALLARLSLLSERADQFLAFQHEAAPVQAEVAEFLRKRCASVAAEIRSAPKIADYLLAARDASGADDYRFTTIVNSRKLNALLLRRWLAFLQQNAERNDPVFAPWRAFAALTDKRFTENAASLAAEMRKSSRQRIVADAFANAPTTLRDVALRYGALLARFNRPQPFANPEEEALRQVSTARESPLSFEPEEVLDYFTRKDLDELRNVENKLIRLYLDHPGAGPRAMILRESPRGYNQKIFVRGNPNVLGADASGRFLAVLSGERPEPFHKGRGRLELARAVVDPAKPLIARVLVNRVWQWHFGAGLVRTPSDFGTRGTAPGHPELLDQLVRQFIAEGWSLKKLHRHILLSATYRQSSQDNPTHRGADPENRLLWRMNRRRLTFEETRDSLLATAGRLNAAVSGRPIDLAGAAAQQRTLFGTIDRITLPGFYRYFDFPSPDAHVPERHETTTSQQALYLMNNAFVMDQASYLARRTERPAGTASAERITALYRLVYGRHPSADELALGREFVATAPASAAESAPADPWRYGYGSYSASQGRVVGFEPLPVFANGQWRGSAQDVDPFLGRCSLHAQGGNAGRDGALAVIRRWVAPRDGKLSLTGKLSCQFPSIQPHGSGVRGRIVSSRHGQLRSWLVHGTEEPTDVAGVVVQRGDSIDFVADGRGRDEHAGFSWAPVLRMEGAATAKDVKLVWDAAKDFQGSPAGSRRYGTWDRYAQVLLEANEYLYLD